MRWFGSASATPLKDGGLNIALESQTGSVVDMEVRGEQAAQLKQCILGEPCMAANPGKRVVDTVQAFTKELEAHADSTLSDMGAKKDSLKAKMTRTRDILMQPWESADKFLDDYINQLTNGGPPLDDA